MLNIAEKRKVSEIEIQENQAWEPYLNNEHVDIFVVVC